jgi:hypothetical protein
LLSHHLAFLAGGIAGTLAFNQMQYSALLLPGSITAVMALAYWLYRSRAR